MVISLFEIQIEYIIYLLLTLISVIRCETSTKTFVYPKVNNNKYARELIIENKRGDKAARKSPSVSPRAAV